MINRHVGIITGDRDHRILGLQDEVEHASARQCMLNHLCDIIGRGIHRPFLSVGADIDVVVAVQPQQDVTPSSLSCEIADRCRQNRIINTLY